MTNISRQSFGVNQDRGRQVVDRLAKDTAARLKQISGSRPFLAFLIVSAVVLGIYYFLIAVPIYVSETSFSVRGREQGPADGSLLATLGGGGASGPTSTDMAELNTYVLSYDMATKLDQKFHLREIYSKPRLDFLYWLPRDASRESFLSFYRKMVTVRIDHDTNLITVKTRAFDPVMAQQLAYAVLELSSEYANNLSAVIRRDTVKTSEQELQQAEAAVRQARLAMTNYRAATGMLDPALSAATTSAGMGAMQQEILEARAQLAEMLSFNRPDAPTVRQLQARIDGLQAQIADQKRQIANTTNASSITQRLREYEGLMISTDYADKQLVAALTSYDSARSLANQRERFIVPAVPPNLPDEPTEPHRLMAFLEALMVLSAIYGIFALAIAGIRDHQGI